MDPKKKVPDAFACVGYSALRPLKSTLADHGRPAGCFYTLPAALYALWAERRIIRSRVAISVSVLFDQELQVFLQEQ